MSVKTSADVLIGGKIYTLSGYESEEYLQKVANYINNKINEFDEMEQFRQIPLDMKATLLELNIADDYFKAKEQAEMLEKTVREKEKEIYELQHDLISAKIKVESSEETTANLEKENKELLLNKAKLETSLADALLGKVKGQTPTDRQPVSGEVKQAPENNKDAKQASENDRNAKQASENDRNVRQAPASDKEIKQEPEKDSDAGQALDSPAVYEGQGGNKNQNARQNSKKKR